MTCSVIIDDITENWDVYTDNQDFSILKSTSGKYLSYKLNYFVGQKKSIYYDRSIN